MNRTPPWPSGDGHVEETFAGLLCGLILGATLGLLLAPQSGRDSRAWITQQAQAIVQRRGIRGLLERSGAMNDADGLFVVASSSRRRRR
jgi:hypothetical protein